MSLYRGYRNIKVLEWVDTDHFIGTIEYGHPSRPAHIHACYGWSKGGSFFIYKIVNGHIEKLGTVKRHVVLDDEPEGV